MSLEMSRRQFVAASSLALLGLATGCGAPSRGQGIDQITWALPTLGDSLFVPRAWNTYVGATVSLVQEGLLSFATDLSLTPAVADSWEQVSSTEYRYALRSGVAFGDGSPLTAEDVVASFRYHMDPASASQLAPFFSSVASVETAGSDVVVNLDAPNVQFMYTPAHMAGFIFKKSQLETSGDSLGTPRTLPLGTGPYRLTEFVPGDRVVLDARDDYWGVKPVVRRIVLREIVDRQTCLLAMRSGDIDGTFDLALGDVEQWKALDNADVLVAPSLSVNMFTLDRSKPPFDDVHVRRAIAHAVDRVGIVRSLMKGQGTPATALNPPEMWTGVLSPAEVQAFYSTIMRYDFDLDRARSELALSNHPQGFDITVPGSTADPYQINILQTVAENLRQIGIRMSVQEVDNNQWLGGYFRHENLGMQIVSYFADFPDPINLPELFLSSANAVVDGLNASNFRNAEVDAALAIANSESDPAVRAESLKKVLRIANEDVAVVPIAWPASAMAINKSYKLDGYNAFYYSVPWAVRGLAPRSA
jgi:peptide/nickel transport system substrate-binding protein